MNFHIKIPAAYLPEQKYIINTIFNYFWGFKTTIETHKKKAVEISNDLSEGVVIVSSGLFLTPEDQWLTPSSLPQQPLATVEPVGEISEALVSNSIPVIYGAIPETNKITKKTPGTLALYIDVFGSAFFMMSRYEEVVKKEKDALGRFPAKASLAVQEGFINRPIINEYIEILWLCVKQMWPNVKRKERTFTMSVSHDVDAPFKYALFNPVKMSKRIIKTGLREGITKAGNEFKNWQSVQKGGILADPYDTFDEIMNISEQHNCRSAFYFIADHTDKNRDGHYSINQPIIKNLLERIHQRGHEIGLHPSFNSYNDGSQIKTEFNKLRETCSLLGISPDQWGGRQHYLRWQTPETFQYWEDAGLNYDSTLTYASQAGFRCGICFSFPVFNVSTRKKLNLIEKPLIVMEATVLDERYMGLGKNMKEAFQMITLLKDRCKKYDGNFTLLWHNNRFVYSSEKELYQQVLKH